MSIYSHEVTATLHPTTGLHGQIDLPVISAQVTLDEAWTPQMSATLIVPAAAATSIDPRRVSWITIDLVRIRRTNRPATVADMTALIAGKTLNQIHYSSLMTATLALTGTTVTPERRALSVTLVIRKVTIDHITQQATILLAGAESILMEWRNFATPWTPPREGTPPFDSVIGPSTIIERLCMMSGVGPIEWDDLHLPDLGGPTQPALDGKMTAWDYIQSIKASVIVLWHGPDNIWHANPVNDLSPGTSRTLSALQMTACTSARSRDDDWYGAVAFARADTKQVISSAYNAGYTRALWQEIPVAEDGTPDPSGVYASAALARARTRGRLAEVTAVLDPDYRPLDRITCMLPDGYGTVTGRLSAVTFDTATSEMTLTLRDTADLVN